MDPGHHIKLSQVTLVYLVLQPQYNFCNNTNVYLPNIYMLDTKHQYIEMCYDEEYKYQNIMKYVIQNSRLLFDGSIFFCFTSYNS